MFYYIPIPANYNNITPNVTHIILSITKQTKSFWFRQESALVGWFNWIRTKEKLLRGWDGLDNKEITSQNGKLLKKICGKSSRKLNLVYCVNTLIYKSQAPEMRKLL